jgi:hypothetical protein
MPEVFTDTQTDGGGLEGKDEILLPRLEISVLVKDTVVWKIDLGIGIY